MTDLETAKNNLSGHTLCLCKEGNCIYSNLKGIAPMMNLIAAESDLNGYSAADLIVGKAVAMLFVKSGIKSVYAQTLSEHGKAILEKYKIPYEYQKLTQSIINRTGTGPCPMEKAISDTDDIEQAYLLLKEQLKNT